MFKLLIAHAIAATVLCTFAARAEAFEIKPYQGKVGESYRVNGKAVSDAEAFQAALKGAEVEKCQAMEVSLNKNGTGATLKAKKR